MGQHDTFSGWQTLNKSKMRELKPCVLLALFRALISPERTVHALRGCSPPSHDGNDVKHTSFQAADELGEFRSSKCRVSLIANSYVSHFCPTKGAPCTRAQALPRRPPRPRPPPSAPSAPTTRRRCARRSATCGALCGRCRRRWAPRPRRRRRKWRQRRRRRRCEDRVEGGRGVTGRQGVGGVWAGGMFSNYWR